MFLIGTAFAFTGDEVVKRVEETRALRAKSLMAEHMPTIPDEAYRSAAEGTPETGIVGVEGYKAKKAWGVAVVDQPIAKFYAAVNDDASKPLYGKLSFTEVLSGGLCGEDRHVFMYLPITMLTDRYWVSHTRQNMGLFQASGGEVREMTWDTVEPDIPVGKRSRDYLEKGMPIEFAKGGWFMTRLDDGHTLVEYWTWTDPGGYVPAGLASSMAAGGIKDTIDSMARLAKEGPRCELK
ncbi:MAG: hypothetical protein H6737_13635 [Alphaproteobacteria bacterium]|nr:hypothetical protein [Alphaproteobacteria bacterium]